MLLPGHTVAKLPARAVLPTWQDNLDVLARDLAGYELAIGYSLGARVALGLVAMGTIPRAILIGLNPGLTTDAERTERRASDAKWATMLRTDGIAKFSDAWQAQPLFATQSRVAQARLDERRSYRRGQDPEALARCLGSMGLAEMPDYRAAVDDRVRLIVGADDAKYLAIAKGLPAPLTVIEESGHDPTLEQPERLTDAIAAIKW